jgi:catechol 2,3-dioxygenase-like lactoylglutathione lyase family enzyme
VIDHVGVNVGDLAASRAFYEQALAPLDYSVVIEYQEHIGFGSPFPDFWIARRGEPTTPAHVAFRAESRAVVDAFHAAALAAGGRDNGAPGPRPDYHEHYYGAYVLDPDQYRVELIERG